jgi:hypothetical protein
MSHFPVVVLLPEPDGDDLAVLEPRAEIIAREQEAAHRRGALAADPPIRGDAKTLRTWAEEQLSSVMKLWNENVTYPPYPTACHCIGDRAKREVKEKLAVERPDLFGDLEHRRKQFRAIRQLRSALDHPDPDGFPPRPSETRRYLIEHDQAAQQKLKGLGLNALLSLAVGPEVEWLKACSGLERQGHIATVNAVSDRLDAEWKAVIAEREELTKQRESEHPDINSPNPVCGYWHFDNLRLDSLEVTPELVGAAYELELQGLATARYATTGPLGGDQQARRLAGLREAWNVLRDESTRAAYISECEAEAEQGGHCLGTGTVMSTYNENSKWDWFVIGGRWAGYFAGESGYDPATDPRNFEPCYFCHQTGLINSDGPPFGAATPAQVSAGQTETCHVCDGTKIARRFGNAETEHDIVSASVWRGMLKAGVEKVVPYAVVSPAPDGVDVEGEGYVWNERGKMGWWGISRDDIDRKEWAEQVLEIARAFSEGYVAVLCDCHI